MEDDVEYPEITFIDRTSKEWLDRNTKDLDWLWANKSAPVMGILMPPGPHCFVFPDVQLPFVEWYDGKANVIEWSSSYHSVFEKYGVNEFSASVCVRIAKHRLNEHIDRICENYRIANDMVNMRRFSRMDMSAIDAIHPITRADFGINEFEHRIGKHG